MNNEDLAMSLPPLRIQPDSVDFGCLKPGETGKVLVKVSGGPAKVVVNNDQVKVEPSSFDSEGELNVTLSPGSAGNLIWDNFILYRDDGELKVLVTARWDVPSFQMSTTKNDQSPADVSEKEKADKQDPERKYKGRACAWCGKNFGYDAESQSWEQCHCNWYQKGINGGSRIVKDLRYGAKDLPSYIQELWNVVLGKEKW